AGIRAGADFAFFERLAESLETGKGIGMLVEFLTPAGKPKPTEDQIKALNAMLPTMNHTKAFPAVASRFRGLIGAIHNLNHNQARTLAVISALDPLKKGVDELKGTMANLEVVVIDNADHMTAFGRPHFVQALQDFLAKNSTSVGAGKGTAP